MKRFITCGVQMDIKTGDIKHNLSNAITLVEKGLKFEPKLIVFPEMFATGFAYPYLNKMALSFFKELASFIVNLSARTNAYVVGGSIPELFEGKLYNTTIVAAPDRKVIGYYRKVHPFSVNEEGKYFTGGDHIEPIETDICKIGVEICYDVRFPEISRKLTLGGAELLIVPAQFPNPRLHHWETLLKARAIENQVFVMGVNRVGGKNPDFFGHSMTIDPYGDVIGSVLDNKEGLLITEINPGRLDEVRKAMPVLEDRRPETYT